MRSPSQEALRVSFVGITAIALALGAACTKEAPDRSCESPASCKSACDAGGTGACTRVARWMLVGEGTPRDLKGGIALLESACAADEATACVTLSAHYRSGVGVGRDKWKADQLADKAIARYETECNKTGAADSCYALARARREGPLRLRDLKEASRLDKRTIELTKPECAHSVASCRLLGAVVQELPERGANTPESMELLDLACTGGSGMACFTRADQNAKGLGIPKDDAKAAGYFQHAIDLLKKQCELGVADRCTALASTQSSAASYIKPAPDPAPAYTKACELGDPVGCAYAGPSIGQDFGDRKADPKRGDELEQKGILIYSSACDEGWGTMCFEYAHRLLFRIAGERGIARDHVLYFTAYNRGVDLLTQDCQADDVNACRTLADAFATKGKFGDKVADDPGKAKSFFTRACALGDEFACRKAKVIAVPATEPSASMVEVPLPVPFKDEGTPSAPPSVSASSTKTAASAAPH